MIKGKVLSFKRFTSKNGKPLTNITVLFSNGQVANVLAQGSPSLEKDLSVEFEVVPSGQYMTASVALVVK